MPLLNVVIVLIVVGVLHPHAEHDQVDPERRRRHRCRAVAAAIIRAL
jgi:hypothetical protein